MTTPSFSVGDMVFVGGQHYAKIVRLLAPNKCEVEWSSGVKNFDTVVSLDNVEKLSTTRRRVKTDRYLDVTSKEAKEKEEALQKNKKKEKQLVVKEKKKERSRRKQRNGVSPKRKQKKTQRRVATLTRATAAAQLIEAAKPLIIKQPPVDKATTATKSRKRTAASSAQEEPVPRKRTAVAVRTKAAARDGKPRTKGTHAQKQVAVKMEDPHDPSTSFEFHIDDHVFVRDGRMDHPATV